jgi:signal transduction histidine kinase
MLTLPDIPYPNGLAADADAVLLLRKLAISILGVGVLLGSVLLLNGDGIRISVVLALIAGVIMLLLVRSRRLIAAAHVLCWGLLLSGTMGIYVFGIRSTGALLLPLAIMSGGWLLGRIPAACLAIAGSSVSLWAYFQHVKDPTRGMPPVGLPDALGHVAIFMVTAMLAAAMAATLRRQYDKVNALAKGLQESNATLEERVAERSAQLASVQQKVMDTEKLTSLGAMVAGISHELNTPLGNALTVSTSLEAQVRSLSQRVESGKLTRTEMAEFLTGAAAMAQLATQAVTRAADLVASFKQIAVDQTSEQRRSFQLDRVVIDNIAALRPSLPLGDLAIAVNIAEDILCDSYPGPLGQVVSNLVQNAALHGLEGNSQGCIEVSAQVVGDQVHLSVTDAGCGMEPQVLARVFEPFFTTRLGKGGSGLGLSLSHRIATSVLGGTLTARSAPGAGSTFTLTFPQRLRGAV